MHPHSTRIGVLQGKLYIVQQPQQGASMHRPALLR
jgi:hypothetical protein